MLKKGGPIQSFFFHFFQFKFMKDKFDTNLNLPCGNLLFLIKKIINVKAFFIHNLDVIVFVHLFKKFKLVVEQGLVTK
jgi:hypothetical protein